MAAVTIIFPDRPLGVTNAVASLAALRAEDSTDATEATVIVVKGIGTYSWDSLSLTADNGSTVIKPNDRTNLQAGRWIGVPGEIVSVQDFGAAGDGITDDTVAIQAAIDMAKANGGTIVFRGGTYLVETLTIDGANYELDTSSGVTFKQKSGLSGTHPILHFSKARRVSMGGARFIGNIATDTGEAHHAVYMESCKSVSLGSLYGTDIRGDVLYHYARDSSYDEMAFGNFVESVSGTNVFRCLVALVGGGCDVGAIINDGPVGYREFDVEPNIGGAYQPVSTWIGYIRGGCSQITSDDVAIKNNRVEIGTYEADWNLIAATTPAYTSPPGANGFGLNVGYCRSVKIGLLKLKDYKSFPVNLHGGWDSFRIDTLHVENCNQTENTYKSIFVQQGTAGRGLLEIGYMTGVLTAADRIFFRANAGELRVKVSGGAVTASNLAVNATLDASDLYVDANSWAGFILLLSPKSRLTNCEFANDSAATLSRQSNDVVLENVTAAPSVIATVNNDNMTIINSVLNGARYQYRRLSTNAAVAVASAATVTLPLDRDVITISGTTGITSITAGAANAERVVTLVFQAAVTVTDGSNLRLNANFTSAANGTLSLACDGTNWYETARSPN